MSAVTIEERARRVDAALAEIGYPVGTARSDVDVVRVAAGVPIRDRWRALQIAGPTASGHYRCFACTLHADGVARPATAAKRAVWAACEAFLPLTEDCGRDR